MNKFSRVMETVTFSTVVLKIISYTEGISKKRPSNETYIEGG